MYIIAIAWIYVVLMMSITEPTLVAGIMTFLMYCVLPLALFLYLWRTPARKKQRERDIQLMKAALARDKLDADNPQSGPDKSVG
ncbi:hypothetical protein LPB67_06765 [Undibacterium sp. Jales W-56]|uniref:hypothetical protein n=1 Tax=Undibacterium sp. Jales W-56 TaxID=2897325 RepID=UPI0021D33466|nr:hypothetical protein [Undibacterium sp. Jales W-56]MCU6433483.1 hypothetical protein [Undibacterium sp. Jales W-56]